MNNKLEQRGNVKICMKLRKPATKMSGVIQQVNGNAAMRLARCFEWRTWFKRGRTSQGDGKRNWMLHDNNALWASIQDNRGPWLAPLVEALPTLPVSTTSPNPKTCTLDDSGLGEKVEALLPGEYGVSDIPDNTTAADGETEPPFAHSSLRDPDSGICHHSPTAGADGISDQSRRTCIQLLSSGEEGGTARGDTLVLLPHAVTHMLAAGQVQCVACGSRGDQDT